MRAKRAFTLIEILVVVGIIALLLAIVLPTLSAAREQARVVACKTRLRELYHGHAFYAQESRNRFPHWDWWLWDNFPDDSDIPESQADFFPSLYAKTGGSRPAESSRWVEFGHIYRFLRSKEVYLCPKDSMRRTGDSIGAGGKYGNRAIHSYSRFIESHDWLNQRLDPQAGSADEGKLTEADFVNPDRLRPRNVVPSNQDVPPLGPWTSSPDRVGLMCEEYPGFDEVSSGVNVSQQSGALNDGVCGFMYWGDFLSWRHGSRGHVSYWDGHTALLDAKKFDAYPATPYAAIMAMGASRR